MMLETKHFGNIDILEEEIISFPEGVPGFESVKKFVLLNYDEEKSAFNWLQSVDEPSLAFVLVNPFEIKKDYEFDVDDEVLKLIDVKKQEEMAVFSIVVIPEDIKKTSMNLKAPVIINSRAKKGMQVVLNSDKYTVRHYIADEIISQEVAANVGASEEKGTGDCDK